MCPIDLLVHYLNFYKSKLKSTPSTLFNRQQIFTPLHKRTKPFAQMPRRACIPRHQTSSRGGRVNCWIITEQRWRRLRLELDCVCLGIGHLVPLSNLTASFTCDASARKSTPSNQLQFAGSNSDLRLNSLWCVWWTFFFFFTPSVYFRLPLLY